MTIYFNWLSAGWITMAIVGFATNFYLLWLARRGEKRAPEELHGYASLRSWRVGFRQAVHATNFAIGWLGMLIPPAHSANQTLTVTLFGFTVVVGLFLVHALVVADGFLELYSVERIRVG